MKKKICFFSGDISRNGGTERVTTLIANELKIRGYDISILSYQGGNESYFELNPDIKLYTLIDKDIHMNKITKQYYPSYLLYKFIRDYNIDLIVDVDILLSLYTLPLKLFTDIKVISWEHFNLNSNRGVKKRDWARKIASIYADKIIVLTQADKNAYGYKFRNIKNVEYIYNPASFNGHDIDRNSREKIIVSVGRLVEQKGFDLLLNAWSKIEKQSGDWKLIIIGSGEEYDNLISLKRNLGLRKVEMEPFSYNIKEYYNKASLYVMSSRYEGFPMVLLEAQACGLPIVSFDCKTGPNEIVRNYIDGVLVEDGNIDMLAHEIYNLIYDEKKINEYSINAKENSKNFSVNIIVDKWEQVLKEILNK